MAITFEPIMWEIYWIIWIFYIVRTPKIYNKWYTILIEGLNDV